GREAAYTGTYYNDILYHGNLGDDFSRNLRKIMPNPQGGSGKQTNQIKCWRASLFTLPQLLPAQSAAPSPPQPPPEEAIRANYAIGLFRKRRTADRPGVVA